VVVGGVALLVDGVTRGVVVICEVSPVAASVETVAAVVAVGGLGSHVQQSLASGSKF